MLRQLSLQYTFTYSDTLCREAKQANLLDSPCLPLINTLRRRLVSFSHLSFDVTLHPDLSFDLTIQIFVILNLVRIDERLFADLSEAFGFTDYSSTHHFAGSGRSVGVKDRLFSAEQRHTVISTSLFTTNIFVFYC